MAFVGALGAWAVGGAVAATSMTAVVVGGAIIGAVVGGIAAAVTGGNILEGVLYGAIGGAALAGIAGWAAPAFMGVGGSASATNAAGVAATGGSFNAASASSAAAQLAAAETAAGVGTTAVVTESTAGGFMASLLAEESTLAVGAASGIKSLGDMYMDNKKMEALEKENDKKRTFTASESDKALASAERRTAMTTGGSAAATRSDESYSEVARINAEGAISKQEAANRGAIAQTELQVADNEAARESDQEAAQRSIDLASGGSAVTTGATGVSKSTESLTDIQDRIRAGESIDGDVNTSVVPNVQYALA